uniref:Extracellular membrane protein CFEM domain-containing protein n=1 Tax=Amphimedon queenslandica TaxID=400682 RepID=A0A1X7SKD0_AMPQE
MISGFPTIAAAVVTLLCITDQCTAQTTNCSALASNGDCSFYDCLSTKFQCTANDYPLAYGRKYCLRYASKSNCFSTG